MGFSRGVPLGLVLAVVALLTVSAFGVAGRDAVTLTLQPFGDPTVHDLAALAAADVAWVLAATLVLARTSAEAALWPAFRLAMLTNVALVALTTVVLASPVGTAVTGRPGSAIRQVTEGDPWATQLDAPGLRFGLSALLVLVALVALLGVVLIVGTTVATRDRFFRHRVVTLRERTFGRGARRSATPEEVLDAVVTARRALQGSQHLRRAVIAAYAAMERAIEAHGTQRRAAQTPTEFLRSALDSGVLQDPPTALRLLRLFELARFSHEELPSDAVDQVDRDLATVQAELERARVSP